MKDSDKTKEEREADNLNQTQAFILSGIDREEQKEVAKVLKNTREQRVRDQAKLISKYKQAPEEIKEQIKKGAVDLADIDLEIFRYEQKTRYTEALKSKDKDFRISKKGCADRGTFGSMSSGLFIVLSSSTNFS